MFQTILRYILATAVALATFIAFKRRIVGFLISKKVTAINYAGVEIVNGAGLLLAFSSLTSSLVLLLLESDTSCQTYLYMVLTLSFAGLLDDIMGDPQVKGLSGHVRSLLKGGFSTGILKAVTGLALGIVLALDVYSDAVTFLVDIFLFVLCVNMINLLDLRPGRAIKGWVLISLIFLCLGRFDQTWILLPLTACICLYAKDEMLEVYMLGDTGSCLLGGTAGFYAVMVLPITAKVAFVFLLSVLHLLAEYVSLSVCIEKVSILRKLDRLGRKE
ncbi:MAG TPA: hypothetical protein PK830_02195 [Candidatus Atribacteria bacterium]|nr:hypothetical protein [Candidatus Atribacteria bacterium]HPT77904.1 hypothetical protein [Candidatus Atribacteria bacterium]